MIVDNHNILGMDIALIKSRTSDPWAVVDEGSEDHGERRLGDVNGDFVEDLSASLMIASDPGAVACKGSEELSGCGFE